MNIFGLSITRSKNTAPPVNEPSEGVENELINFKRDLVEVKRQVNRIERKVYRDYDRFNNDDNHDNHDLAAIPSGRIDWSKFE